MNKTDRNGGKEKETNFESIEYSRKLALKLCMHLKLELNSFFHVSFCNFINICSWMQFDWNVNPFECIRNSNTKLNDPNGDSVWNNKKTKLFERPTWIPHKKFPHILFSFVWLQKNISRWSANKHIFFEKYHSLLEEHLRILNIVLPHRIYGSCLSYRRHLQIRRPANKSFGISLQQLLETFFSLFRIRKVCGSGKK